MALPSPYLDALSFLFPKNKHDQNLQHQQQQQAQHNQLLQQAMQRQAAANYWGGSGGGGGSYTYGGNSGGGWQTMTVSTSTCTYPTPSPGQVTWVEYDGEPRQAKKKEPPKMADDPELYKAIDVFLDEKKRQEAS